MGAIAGLMKAQYETLRAMGHSPSEAFNETVEEATQSLYPLIGANGMDWMFASCSTTAQRGALDWSKRFETAARPLFELLYRDVSAGGSNRAGSSIRAAHPTTGRSSKWSSGPGGTRKCGRRGPLSGRSGPRTGRRNRRKAFSAGERPGPLPAFRARFTRVTPERSAKRACFAPPYPLSSFRPAARRGASSGVSPGTWHDPSS